MKEKKKDIKDLIIKIILIVIIIILLIHNCVLVNKKKKTKTPSGNVNIIEITCVDNNKCDVTDKRTDNEDASSDNKEDITDEGTDSTTNNTTRKSSNDRNNNNVNGNGNGSSSDSGESTTTDTVVEPENELFVRDKKLVWNDSSDLKIFTNSVYNFEEKIAPETSNTYQFIVKNSTSYKVKYNISFVETNPYNINMKYKLKKNNSYVVDHYVSYNNLNISDQLLNAKNNDTFYLDWKWISSDNDNDVGENGANYSLKIEVNAESVD